MQLAFILADTLTCQSRKIAGATNNIIDDSVLFTCPGRSKPEAAKWSPAISRFINFTCAFANVTCEKNVHGKWR